MGNPVSRFPEAAASFTFWPVCMSASSVSDARGGLAIDWQTPLSRCSPGGHTVHWLNDAHSTQGEVARASAQRSHLPVDSEPKRPLPQNPVQLLVSGSKKGAPPPAAHSRHAAGSSGRVHVLHAPSQRLQVPVVLAAYPAGHALTHWPPRCMSLAGAHVRQLAGPGPSQVAHDPSHGEHAPAEVAKEPGGQDE